LASQHKHFLFFDIVNDPPYGSAIAGTWTTDCGSEFPCPLWTLAHWETAFSKETEL